MTDTPSQNRTPRHYDIESIDPDTMEKGKLFPTEAWVWRDRAHWLEERGWTSYEDKAGAAFGGVILDAMRISDGTRVLMKFIKPSEYPREIPTSEMFSSNPLASDPQNHCIPILETLVIPDEDDAAFLVMPFLTSYLEPKFSTVGELLEMSCQLFEGIHFMHMNNISHCDSKDDNFMMDGLPLYSSPPHPGNLMKHFKYTSGVTSTSRTTMRVRTPYGGDKTVPEFKNNVQCDPFKVDVYQCLGNFVRETFLEGEKPTRNLGFIKPLIDSMVQDDPNKRPIMSEVTVAEACQAGFQNQKSRNGVLWQGLGATWTHKG